MLVAAAGRLGGPRRPEPIWPRHSGSANTIMPIPPRNKISRGFVLCILALMLASASAQTVEISVFGSLKPQALTLRAAPGSVILVNGTPLKDAASIQVRLGQNRTVHVAARNGVQAEFVLTVPAKITRRFRGLLEIRPAGDRLLALVRMDLETAVAAVTAAESGPGAPRQELKAQAVLARSFFIAAGRRHQSFDFCDTTHCQFFRAPPPEGSPAAQAVAETRGLVLKYQGHVFPPLYSSNCGGRTRLPGDIGLRVEIYPYFAVDCARRGQRMGHGVGLCQTGATAMARAGTNFRAILNHYYPGTLVQQYR